MAGYAGLYENISTALRERGQVVVSPDYDNLVKGADCLEGQLDIWASANEKFGMLADFDLVYVGKTKTKCSVYELVRKVR